MFIIILCTSPFALCSLKESEKTKWRGEIVRDTIFMEFSGRRISNSECSQAVPDRPSGKGKLERSYSFRKVTV
jgi:hypothetical protein